MSRLGISPFIRVALLGAVFVVAAISGGCKKNNGQLDAALMENNELRGRIESLEQALRDCDAQKAGLEQQLAAAPTSPSGYGTSGTGFENIGGIDVSYGAGGEIIVGVAGDVLFDSGSVVLKNTSKQTLDRVAGVLNSQYRRNVIRVEGHTDSDPIRKSKWRSNEQLSAERALAVEEYLVSKGVNNNRVYSAAFGPAKPKGTKKDSRRVEIVILAEGAV
ncbi:MAG: OmpA family protein [Phycisphaeraceae bacterium]|nr:OmpA family protein [Phycisphaeraceae bacterium]MBX3368334.1 OmpA family protein [Phycisphaeraceae bacterium]